MYSALPLGGFTPCRPREIVIFFAIGVQCGKAVGMSPDGVPPERRSRQNAVAQAAGIGFAIAAGLILPIVGGLVLDRWLGRAPLFTLLGVALGLVVAGYELFKITKTTASLPETDLGIDPEEKARRLAEWERDHPDRYRDEADADEDEERR